MHAQANIALYPVQSGAAQGLVDGFAGSQITADRRAFQTVQQTLLERNRHRALTRDGQKHLIQRPGRQLEMRHLAQRLTIGPCRAQTGAADNAQCHTQRQPRSPYVAHTLHLIYCLMQVCETARGNL